MPDDRSHHSLAPRAAIRSGDLRKTVFLLSLPVLAEQFLSFCVGFYDTWLSGRISAEATSAVGLAAYVSWLAAMLFGLVGTGTTALVARHWGAGEFEDARRVTDRSMALSLVVGVAIGLLTAATAPGFASLLGMEGSARTITVRYLRFDAVGHVFTSASLIGAAALRGTGNMRMPMFVLGLTSVVNVIASTTLVYGIGPVGVLGIDGPVLSPMGIDGIVFGTVIARACGGLFMMLVLCRGPGGLRLSFRRMTLRGETVRRILRIGTPAAVDGAVTWCGQLLFLMIIARLASGAEATATFAAHIVGVRLEALTYLPAVAWGCAAATMTGQLLGAGEPDRAVRAGHEAARQCSLLALGVSVLFLLAATLVYQIMHNDPLVHQIGARALRLLALFQIPSAMSIVYVYALRGAGDTRYPLWFTLIGLFPVRLPLAYWLGIHLGQGLWGAWMGMCADTALRALLGWARFQRRGWVNTAV